MLPLETLQRVMTASILSQTSARLGSKLQAGSANPVSLSGIYRNNALISLTGSLKTNFPVTVQLVHERFFHWFAQEFIRRHPPEEARLSSSGAKLPAYLASLPACRSVPYVAEMARLEWAICTSLHAEEHDSCSIEALSRLGEAVGDARLVLQQKVQLIASRWPVIDIWNAHQRSVVEMPDTIARRATYVQVRRIADRVRLSSVSAGRCTFRRGLARGISLDAAMSGNIARPVIFTRNGAGVALCREHRDQHRFSTRRIIMTTFEAAPTNRQFFPGILADIAAIPERIPLSLVQLATRIAVGHVFWASAQSKLVSWPVTLQLFAFEYRVPILPPDMAASLATAAELSGSVLLFAGLLTRLAALQLLGVVAVVQLFVFPGNWPEHLLWTSGLLLLLARGPGMISLDFIASRLLARRGWL